MDSSNISQFNKDEISVIKDVEEKIKTYFKNFSTIGDINQENLINLYFEEYQNSHNINFDEIYNVNPNFDITADENNKKALLNAENKNIQFAHLKVFDI